MTTHWHVERHPGDDDTYMTTTLYEALDYAGRVLADLSEFHYEGISANGDADDYELAYQSFVISNELDVLARNATHIADMHAGRKPLAPLYIGNEQYLEDSGISVAYGINSSSAGMSIWDCNYQECELSDEDWFRLHTQCD